MMNASIKRTSRILVAPLCLVALALACGDADDAYRDAELAAQREATRKAPDAAERDVAAIDEPEDVVPVNPPGDQGASVARTDEEAGQAPEKRPIGQRAAVAGETPHEASAIEALGSGDPEAGRETYDRICVSCHGPSGTGDGPLAQSLQTQPRNFAAGDFKFDTDGDGQAGEPVDLANVILNGAAAYGGSPLMAPWPNLSPQEVANVVAYIRAF